MTSRKTLKLLVILILTLIYKIGFIVLGLDKAHGSERCNLLEDYSNTTNLTVSSKTYTIDSDELVYFIDGSTDTVIENNTFVDVKVLIYIANSTNLKIGRTILKGNAELHIYLVGKNNRHTIIDTQLRITKPNQYSFEMIDKYPKWLRDCMGKP